MCRIHNVCPFFIICRTSREVWPHPVRHSPTFSSVSFGETSAHFIFVSVHITGQAVS